MKNYILISVIVFSISETIAQSYNLLPLNHTDKWVNGKEWSIEKINNVTVQAYFSDVKSGKALYNILVLNETDEDINIDPDKIFSKTIEHDTAGIYKAYRDHKRKDPRSRISKQSYFEDIFNKNDTIYVEKSDKLMKNLKTLVGLGILFDSDNALIGRGFSKIDYYKQNILLKHTIEPNIPFQRLLIIDKTEYPNVLELNIPLNGSVFKIQFERDKEG